MEGSVDEMMMQPNNCHSPPSLRSLQCPTLLPSALWFGWFGGVVTVKSLQQIWKKAMGNSNNFFARKKNIASLNQQIWTGLYLSYGRRRNAEYYVEGMRPYVLHVLFR